MKNKKKDNIAEIVVTKVVNPQEKTTIKHPKGVALVIEPGVFLRNAEVEINTEVKEKLVYAFNSFQIHSTELSQKWMEVSVRLGNILIGKGVKKKSKKEKTVPFIEVNEGGKTFLFPGKLQEHTLRNHTEHSIVAMCELFREENEAFIGCGVFVYPAEIKQVFHPVQHQFKIHETKIQKDVDGNSRREDDEGNACPGSPYLSEIYPACYPASWAALFSAYKLTPAHPRRAWETGTPTVPNPPPNEFGDFFSTWSMGTDNPGIRPQVARVEDWQADPEDPTPETITGEAVSFPIESSEAALAERAELIKSVLLWEVGGQSTPLFLPVKRPRPVRMSHSKHAWVIVGVEKDGFWEHAMEPDAWALSSFCSWENAPWIGDGKAHHITYPPDSCSLKPVNRRLGCIGFEGSGDYFKRIRFWDVYTNLEATVINWAPHTGSEPGYLWIHEKEPLTCEGYPKSVFHSDLGHVIPRPTHNFGHCSYCDNNEDGCKRCRSRLLLPFYVHNTTLDETLSFKVDLYFWNKDRRWVILQADLLPERAKYEDDDLHCGFPREKVTPPRYDRWKDYKLPGPLPGELFSIEATKDTGSDASQPKGEWNSQGIAWYIDFHRDQVPVDDVYGIRLVLTCVDRAGEPLCLVQDVKQLWFRVSDPAPA